MNIKPGLSHRSDAGFTLVELMIVVVVIGILVAMAIPNYASMQANAKEAVVKSNCHTVVIAAEDFSVRNDGFYPASTVDVLPTGETLIDLLINGNQLRNPFTGGATEPVDGAAATAGQTGYQLVLVNGINSGYIIDGFGRNATVLVLTNN
jgi:prepilin-type N-terminal cleavage/methylation domain-containing protein